MSIYRFNSTSSLDEITFARAKNGGVRAYLHAKDNTPPSTLAEIIQDLHEHACQAIPTSMGGKPVLEVRDFKNEKQLLKLGRDKGWISGEGTREATADDTVSWKQWVTNNTMQVSGGFYLLGDAAFTMYGYKESHPEDMLAGLSYFAGTSSLLAFGQGDKSSNQVQDMADAMEKFLEKNKTKIPESCSLKAITDDHKKGMLGNAHDFCKRYPSELMNTFYGIAGLMIARSAYKYHIFEEPPAHYDAFSRKLSRTQGWLDVGLGGLTAASGAISTLIKEKKTDPDEPSATGMNKVWNWIQEKPLRVAGYGYIASTLCHAGSTAIAMYDAKRIGETKRLESVPYRALFVAANLVAEAFLAMSSKGHGDGVTSDESVKKSLYSMAAETILKQPPELREWHIDHLAGFLQQPQVMAESKEQVKKDLREYITKLEKNPWLCMHQPPLHVAQQQELPQPTVTASSFAQHQQSHMHGPHENWAARVTQPAHTPPTLSA